MFKVGDLVERRPQNPTKTFTQGKAYKVTSLHGTSMIALEGVRYTWQAARFRLATNNIKREIPWL